MDTLYLHAVFYPFRIEKSVSPSINCRRYRDRRQAKKQATGYSCRVK